MCKLCHNKAISKKVRHIHSESLVRVQADGRSHARRRRGSLIWVTEELTSQRTAGLSLSPQARGAKRESSVTIVLSVTTGPPGMIWNPGRTSRLTPEPCRKGCTAEAGHGQDAARHHQKQSEVGRGPGFSPSLFLQGSITGSLRLGL